ncbi:MAG: hypothetical protein CMO26_07065 [Thiotrichales bacterium]|nr:hypothetical protein [Thiotrichales bacterium]
MDELQSCTLTTADLFTIFAYHQGRTAVDTVLGNDEAIPIVAASCIRNVLLHMPVSSFGNTGQTCWTA